MHLAEVRVQCDQKKGQMSIKVAQKCYFTRKMIDFDTFTKIA